MGLMPSGTMRASSSGSSDALRSSAVRVTYLPSRDFWLAAHSSSPRSAESLND